MNHPQLSRPAQRRLALAVVAAFPVLATAQTAIDLDPVVVTGSRVMHNTFDLPASVDVVGAERLSSDQARVNASEVLSGVPGLSVQNRQNYAQDLQISSRGFGARSAFGVRGVRLIADGIPASMPDGQGQVGTFNLDRAERIEVMRGPMSAIYGNHAGGVIQMFTPDGKGPLSVESQVSAGSYGTWKADVSAQGEANGIGYVLDTSYFSTDGYRKHSAADREQSMAKLTFRPSEDGKLTLLASTFHQSADDPQGLTWAEFQKNPRGVAFDSAAGIYPALAYNTRKSIDHTQGGATYEHRFGDQTVTLSAYAGQRDTIQYQSIPKSSQDTAVRATNARQAGGIIDFEREFAGLSGRWSGRFDVLGGRLTTTAGFDFETSTDDRRGYENYVGSTLGVKGAVRRNEKDSVNSFDQYVQAEWQGDRWAFSGGVRHSEIKFRVDDRYVVLPYNVDDSGNKTFERTTPTLAALYRLTDTVNLYASASRGFESPTFNEMFYSANGGAFNFGLKPASSVHYEAGVKAMLGTSTRMDLAVFEIRTDDEIVVLSSSGGRTAYQNAGKTERQGLEWALDSHITDSLRGRLAYTWLDARYAETFRFNTPPPVVTKTVDSGNQIPGVAAHTAFAELVWRHKPTGFYAGIEGVARSKVYVEDTNTQKAAPGYAIANLRVGFEQKWAGLNWRTFLRVDNVFDKQYVGSVIVGDGNNRFYESAPGRTWLAGVSARYQF